MNKLLHLGRERAQKVMEAFGQTPLGKRLLRRPVASELVGVPQQQPGLYSLSGTLLIESPMPLQVRHAEEADLSRRVSYFSFRLPPEEQGKQANSFQGVATIASTDDELSTWLFVNNIGIGANLFHHELVIPYLERYLRERYRDKDIIGIRGTACALEEGVTIQGKRILTPAEIVQLGVENGQKHAAMIGFHPRATDKLDQEISHRSAQWLIDHAKGLRKRALAENNEGGAGKIFPLLLVYDRSKFPPDSTTLPIDPEERAACILEAIILDFPIPMSEQQWSLRRGASRGTS